MLYYNLELNKQHRVIISYALIWVENKNFKELKWTLSEKYETNRWSASGFHGSCSGIYHR